MAMDKMRPHRDVVKDEAARLTPTLEGERLERGDPGFEPDPPKRPRQEVHGASVRDIVSELEREHPDLAKDAPVSSAALEVGEMIRSARRAAGLSQRGLAEAAGLHQSAISAIERGEGKDGPTYRKMQAIAGALGLRLAFMPVDQPFSEPSLSLSEPLHLLKSMGAKALPQATEIIRQLEEATKKMREATNPKSKIEIQGDGDWSARPGVDLGTARKTRGVR